MWAKSKLSYGKRKKLFTKRQRFLAGRNGGLSQVILS